MRASQGGPALFRLVRFWSRRWSQGVADAAASNPQMVLTLEAVRAASLENAAPTVGDLARQLGLDQSGASRMAATGVAAGYLQRGRATTDARRATLELTPAGKTLLDAAQEWQRTTFTELTANWPSRDRARFADYLQRLADEVGA